ncbi:glycosyltransferase family 2 protein [Phreatobacter sp.]|uniref:glycosyltransferase family 2 protein n=1 Tax=Phreatobacter sp. TaxID=1966341 RepID=UPI003F6E4C0A
MTAQAPTLSVVITCFNYEAFICEAIDSVLEQEGVTFEIIVVDDGSTDGSWAKVQTYGDRVTAIRIANGGPLKASMTGFRQARGRFIYFLDADDRLVPGAFRAIAPHLVDKVSKIQFMMIPIDRDGHDIGMPFPKLSRSSTSENLIDSINRTGAYETPPTSGNIYRRDIYENLGDLSYERAIDGVPYLLSPFVGEVVSIDRPLAKYRVHGSSVSAFANLTPERMDGYINRFNARLKHLQVLLRDRGIEGDMALSGDASPYVLEMRMMRAVTGGTRPGLDLSRAYLKAVARERSGAARLFFLGFGALLAALPPSWAIGLVRMRINQSRGIWLRTRIKRLAGFWPSRNHRIDSAKLLH